MDTENRAKVLIWLRAHTNVTSNDEESMPKVISEHHDSHGVTDCDRMLESDSELSMESEEDLPMESEEEERMEGKDGPLQNTSTGRKEYPRDALKASYRDDTAESDSSASISPVPRKKRRMNRNCEVSWIIQCLLR